MIDEHGGKWKMTKMSDTEVIHLTSEKAKALTYFTDKDNLTTNTVNQAVIDNGCPTNVAGKPWINLHAESRGVDKFKLRSAAKYSNSDPA